MADAFVPGYGTVKQGVGTRGPVKPGRKPLDTGQDPNFRSPAEIAASRRRNSRRTAGSTGLSLGANRAATPVGTTAPAPAGSSQVRINVTPNTSVGRPAGVKAAEADRVAALAALAAQQRRQDLALRDEYSQALMGAQSSAADIYGGRAPAIFGQAVTGARRGYVSGRSQQVQESVSERAALKRAYDEAIRQAYVAAAQQRQQDAYNRAQLAMMASQAMGY